MKKENGFSLIGITAAIAVSAMLFFVAVQLLKNKQKENATGKNPQGIAITGTETCTGKPELELPSTLEPYRGLLSHWRPVGTPQPGIAEMNNVYLLLLKELKIANSFAVGKVTGNLSLMTQAVDDWHFRRREQRGSAIIKNGILLQHRVAQGNTANTSFIWWNSKDEAYEWLNQPILPTGSPLHAYLWPCGPKGEDKILTFYFPETPPPGGPPSWLHVDGKPWKHELERVKCKTSLGGSATLTSMKESCLKGWLESPDGEKYPLGHLSRKNQFDQKHSPLGIQNTALIRLLPDPGVSY